MLKFIKEHLATIDNVEIYPVFSLLIFVGVFCVVVYRVIKSDKKEIEELKQIPLNDEE